MRREDRPLFLWRNLTPMAVAAAASALATRHRPGPDDRHYPVGNAPSPQGAASPGATPSATAPLTSASIRPPKATGN